MGILSSLYTGVSGLVAQNARMALKVSHRAYVIETGKVTLEGKGQDLLNDDSVRRSYLGA